MFVFLYLYSALAFIATATVEGILKAFKNEAATKYEKLFVKLHKGIPGTAGTENEAGETTRKEAGTMSGTTTLKNAAAIKWTAVSTAETYKYVSFWTAVTAGTFIGYAQLEAEKTVGVGDNVEIPIEGFTWTVA